MKKLLKYIIIIMIYVCYSYHSGEHGEKRGSSKKWFRFSFRSATSHKHTLTFDSHKHIQRSSAWKIAVEVKIEIYHFYFQFRVEFMVE